ncbi:MAG: alpha/beta hydrolase-fold protein [Bryobacterales bacterium]|nr:alpha/beta hydrolase-fold protein [Bryobacterales bacterium]
MRFPVFLAVAILLGLSGSAVAQFQAPMLSPEVHADRRVTFRLKAPNAKEVFVAREGAARIAMQKGDDGIWTLTSEAWEPDIYGYTFVVDGVSLIDPGNSWMKTNLLNLSNMVHVPGAEALPWEPRDVPKGALHHHFYKSAAAQDSRDFYVYTPPGYNSTGDTRYPVLYLLHGYSDDASGWSVVGQAHVILDNLIAAKKAKPMLVVMPLGYGTMDVIRDPRNAFRDPKMMEKNFGRFRTALLEEVIPQVETAYRVATDKKSRALAGLSMGGAETLLTALNNPDRFEHVGAFSFGGLPQDFAPLFPKVDESLNEHLSTLYIACGVDDRLLGINRKFAGWLKEQNVKHEFVETPGAHTWMVWRRNLVTFASRIF